MKLLIVDDIPINRKLLRVRLEAEGHTALEAADGVDALQVLSREKVDGVISDILMPRMDGYRLCNEIRANRQLRDLAFIFYTSTFVSPADEQMAGDVGADKYLTKPASIETILAAMNGAISMQHASPEPGAVREIEVLKGYSDRLVTKLEEKNLHLERELRMSALSVEIGSALMHGKTLPQTLCRCCEALVRHLDASSATIWTCDAGGESLEWQAGAGEASGSGERIIRPLIVGERLLGIMAVFAAAPFSEAALEKLASVADSIAMGIDHNRSQEDLRNALAEKTTLLQEVHHRVKNNLQVICSLLAMQINCAGGDSSVSALNDAHARVLAVSLIHEQIYQSETVSELDFGEYIDRLSEFIFAAYCIDPSRIQLRTTLEPVRLGVDQAVPCGLILNELLSNVLKHAFTDGRAGMVSVTLQNTPDGFAHLTVADNGVGFAADFQWEREHSLGMKVVRALVKQLRGNLFVSGADGATFRISWQLPVANCRR